LIITCRLYHQR